MLFKPENNHFAKTIFGNTDFMFITEESMVENQ